MKSLEEPRDPLQLRAGTRRSVSTTLFSPFLPFTNLEHQLIPGKTKLSARIPEEHPSVSSPPAAIKGAPRVLRSKVIQPKDEKRGRELVHHGNITRRGKGPKATSSLC